MLCHGLPIALAQGGYDFGDAAGVAGLVGVVGRGRHKWGVGFEYHIAPSQMGGQTADFLGVLFEQYRADADFKPQLQPCLGAF